ncbi:uncharacterized protein AMSG_07927 [Thecamonas trahens ATCC 50062]|uniref:Uncharacterized protein n=1 Tax=Thecamonas trahens ATCC 50062 TaxID=461836 RepID=A0A0L0DHY7_THETB|nr:hypothetical protein AMSG_07927 [Thecamonas trahens ATCC 50062]KNC51840.1 hypothetical protein AMSG_07927 [Thecamonas trahens ATCC 50062]|eukprot:XP_013755705.1 hypothetical protein AMSG_07927 [Thecamonas trahens ATCC 50062]
MSSPPLPIPTRQQRLETYGLDTVSSLVWSEWEVGGEYTKLLTIRNVTTDVVHLRYTLPATKYFSMAFPESFQLSPGIAVSLPIAFRPVELAEYEDVVMLEVRPTGSRRGGRFGIPVTAVLPHLALTAPRVVDLGFCSVKEAVSAKLTLKNDSEVPATFEAYVPPPFSVTPRIGALAPHSGVVLEVVFSPGEAAPFEATLSIDAVPDGASGDERLTSVYTTLHATGKYAFLAVSEPHVEFGDVYLSRTATRVLTLSNVSEVQTQFRVTHATAGSDLPFSISPSRGSVAAHSSINVQVAYKPQAAGLDSTSKFFFETPGGNAPAVMVSGRGAAPSIRLDKSGLAFGALTVGGRAVRVVTVANTSPVVANVAIESATSGVFQFSTTSLALEPYSEAKVQVEFCPHEPMNYARRVAFVVASGVPAYVDVVGTGYADGRRPPDMGLVHVARARKRALLGLGQLPPEALEDAMRGLTESDPVAGNVLLSLDNLSLSAVAESVGDEAASAAVQDPWVPYTHALGLASPHTLPPGVFAPLVTVAPSSLDFGAVPAVMRGGRGRDRLSAMPSASMRGFSVRNPTRGKMTVHARVTGGSAGADAFSLSVCEADVGPGGSVTFSVTFAPRHRDRFYGTSVELFVHYKSMRNFRLVSDATVVPPSYLVVPLLGHSYEGGAEKFMPQVAVVPAEEGVHFKPCVVGEAAYTTVSVVNTGSMPLKFDVGPVAGGEVIDVFPRTGIVDGGESRILSVGYLPDEAGLVEATMAIMINNSSANALEVALAGVCDAPRVVLESSRNGEASLYFKPTHIGSSTVRYFEVTNPGTLPLAFQWVVPSRYAEVLKVSPPSGVLSGGSEARVAFTFTPNSEAKFHMKASCFVMTLAADGAYAGREFELPAVPAPGTDDQSGWREHSLKLYGAGTSAALDFFPRSLDFGNSPVHEPSSGEIRVFNRGEADVGLYVYAAAVSESGTSMPGGQTRSLSGSSTNETLEVIQLSAEFVVVPSRSSASVGVTFAPRARAYYAYGVYCMVLPHESNVDKLSAGVGPDAAFEKYLRGGLGAAGQPLLMADVTGVGELPSLAVADCFVGRSPGKAVWWRRLSLDLLNIELAMNLSRAEEVFAATRENIVEAPMYAGLVSTLPTFDLDLGSGVAGSGASVVRLRFVNRGSTSVKFEFLYPSDLEWCDIQGLSEYDLDEELLRANKLFSFYPKSGHVAADGAINVELTYHHLVPGEHGIDVVLALERGKQVTLALQGVTHAPPPGPTLHFGTRGHFFEPVPIGVEEPFVQSYVLHNDAGTEVAWELENVDAALAAFRAENYDVDVLVPLMRSGRIEPRGSGMVRFVFAPLEAREYAFPLTVAMRNDDGIVVRQQIVFYGVGYHPSLHDVLPWTTAPPSTAPAAPSLGLAPTLPDGRINVVGYLTLERVWFGALPLHSINRCLVGVANPSAERRVAFEWLSLPAQVYGYELVAVEPSSGEIEAGGMVTCSVVFRPMQQPEIYELDIECRLKVLDGECSEGARAVEVHVEAEEVFAVDNSDPARFTGRAVAAGRRGALDSAPRRSRRSLVSRQGDVRGHGLGRPGSVASVRTLAGSSLARGRAAIGLRRAVKLGKVDGSDPLLEAGGSRLDGRIGVGSGSGRVEHVRSHSVWLHISAASFPVEVYKETYADFETFFVPRQTKRETWRTEAEKHEMPAATVSLIKRIQQTPSEEENKTVVKSVLSDILQDIIFDPDIQETIEAVERAPIPLFAQLTPQVPLSVVRSGRGRSESTSVSSIASESGESEQPVLSRFASFHREVASEVVSRGDGERAGFGGGEEAADVKDDEEVVREAVLSRASVVRVVGMDELLEGVFQGTIANLMAEVVDGGFDVLEAPKRVVGMDEVEEV